MLSYSLIEKRLWDMAQMVTVQLQTPSDRKGWARVDYEGAARVISLPIEKHDEYRLRSFIHELFHITFPAELNIWSHDILEGFLEFELEPGLLYFIHANARRHRRWILHMNKLVRGEGGQKLLARKAA